MAFTTEEMTVPSTEVAPVVVVADVVVARREEAAHRLRDAGYHVVAVETSQRALECCRILGPDVVALNADAVDGEGMTVLLALRSDRHLRRIPVVTFSADPGVDRVVDCLRRGARDHIRGPVSAVELVARVDAVLRVADEHERLRRRNEELQYLGSTDELTGLANRRHIEDELDRLAAAAARYHQPLAAVMLAVDRWSELDGRGPETADAVLREVALLIGAIRRTGDLAGRFSTNQFLALLPMTGADGARVFAQRVRAVVAAAPIAIPQGHLEVSVSAGCADGAAGAAELLLRAQDALAKAQAGGGDTLVSISS